MFALIRYCHCRKSSTVREAHPPPPFTYKRSKQNLWQTYLISVIPGLELELSVGAVPRTAEAGQVVWGQAAPRTPRPPHVVCRCQAVPVRYFRPNNECNSASIDRFIEDQAFSRAYDLAPSPPPLSCQGKLDRWHIGRQRKREGRGEEGGEKKNHTNAKKSGPLYHSVLSAVTYAIKYGINAELW